LAPTHQAIVGLAIRCRPNHSRCRPNHSRCRPNHSRCRPSRTTTN